MQFLKSIFEKFSKPKEENQIKKLFEPETKVIKSPNPEPEIAKKIENRKKLQGVIGALGLEDFWYSLTKEEQQALTRYEQNALGASGNESLIKGKFNGIVGVLNFLCGHIGWAISEKNYDLVDKIIDYVDKNQLTQGKTVSAHFYFQDVAEYYYKLRDERENAIELAIEYCLKDIKIYPNYIKPLSKGCAALPFIKTFYRLMIIYEKQGRYEEAIKYCEMAINYGLEDNTKGGYKARLERLKKKLK